MTESTVSLMSAVQPPLIQNCTLAKIALRAVLQRRKGRIMAAVHTSKRKTHVSTERPPFERIALILQGGDALGASQAGVYQALAEANMHPDWVAGISIGAVNSALIAGAGFLHAACAASLSASGRQS
jgi:hypothetical protein